MKTVPESERAKERPQVIDTQWKQCARKPKPCCHCVDSQTLET